MRVEAPASKSKDQLYGVTMIQAASLAFAAIRRDGSVVTWGTPDAGGDSRHVQEQLKNVTGIQVPRLISAS